jgi:hypothetical protein
MHYKSEKEINDLVKRFEEKTLPKEEWTHKAHLTVGMTFLWNHTPDEAICFLRSDIINYNEAVGKENSPYSGYHETMTLFWVWVMMMFRIQYCKEYNFLEATNAFLSSPYASKDFPMSYYSKDVIVSVRARARWVEPDLLPMEL